MSDREEPAVVAPPLDELDALLLHAATAMQRAAVALIAVPARRPGLLRLPLIAFASCIKITFLPSGTAPEPVDMREVPPRSTTEEHPNRLQLDAIMPACDPSIEGLVKIA